MSNPNSMDSQSFSQPISSILRWTLYMSHFVPQFWQFQWYPSIYFVSPPNTNLLYSSLVYCFYAVLGTLLSECFHHSCRAALCTHALSAFVPTESSAKHPTHVGRCLPIVETKSRLAGFPYLDRPDCHSAFVWVPLTFSE